MAVQAQIPSAAGLALRARTEGLTATRVDRARLRDRSIVLTWANRGTLHLVPAEDYAWLVPLTAEPQVTGSRRRLRELEVTGDQQLRAVRAIEQMLDREGPLTRREIAARLRRLGIRTEGQAIAHLIWLAAFEKAVCFGPERDGDRCLVLVRDWIGPRSPVGRDRALSELAVRYLRAHGPATPADLAYWSGIGAADAKRAWRAVHRRLVDVEVDASTMWTLRSRRRDEAPPGEVRLLPSFDEYLLGWKDRRFIADPRGWRRVTPGGGWFHPAVISDGRAVGTWAVDRTSKAARAEVRPFSPPSPTVRRGVAAEAEDLAAYLDRPVDLVVSRPAGR